MNKAGMNHFEIPINSEIENFVRHLDSNPRIIFSAKFGDGKTYFFNKLTETKSNEIRLITLRPINYAVAYNEDIFEYIKRDILLQLKEDGIYDKIDFDAFTSSLFSTENMLDVLEFLIASLPCSELVNKLIKKCAKVKEDYDSKKKDISSYEANFKTKIGCIYERDAYTAIIEEVIRRIKLQEKKVVLLIEDLDRIDPKHLFRVLNILGAHIDEQTNSNKFGFDNILLVMDYEITKHIFHHFYGSGANYSGYISKFVSHYPYTYSITRLAQEYLSSNPQPPS